MDESVPAHETTPDRPTRHRLVSALALALVAAAVGLGVWHAGADMARAAGERLDAAGRGFRELLLGDVRVGIQIGHLRADDHPDEHARLRTSTGGEANGVTEVEINRAVAAELAAILHEEGVTVDLLPASVPPRYRADALVSLHADSSPDPARRGYKSAHFEPARTPQERRLKELVDRSYFSATQLPDDHTNVSGNMLRYYAFDPAYRHAVSPVTPSILLEMGYISNRQDLGTLSDPAVPARAIATGVLGYLREAGRLPDP